MKTLSERAADLRAQIQAEKRRRDRFDADAKAKAFLIALDWAGANVKLLGQAIGACTSAGSLWLMRSEIPAGAALILGKLPGFPLNGAELRPDIDFSGPQQFRCSACNAMNRRRKFRNGYSMPRQDTKEAIAVRAAIEEHRKLAELGRDGRSRLRGPRKPKTPAPKLDTEITCTPSGKLVFKAKPAKRLAG